MKQYLNIKNKILSNDNFANAIEYMMSKVILENPINQLKFFYKKYKIVKDLSNKFSIYNKENKKIFGGIYFQDVAKYIINNINDNSKIKYVLFLEQELFRLKDKIEFMEKSLNKTHSIIIEDKLSNIYNQYQLYKNSLISTINYDILH